MKWNPLQKKILHHLPRLYEANNKCGFSSVASEISIYSVMKYFHWQRISELYLVISVSAYDGSE